MVALRQALEQAGGALPVPGSGALASLAGQVFLRLEERATNSSSTVRLHISGGMVWPTRLLLLTNIEVSPGQIVGA